LPLRPPVPQSRDMLFAAHGPNRFHYETDPTGSLQQYIGSKEQGRKHAAKSGGHHVLFFVALAAGLSGREWNGIDMVRDFAGRRTDAFARPTPGGEPGASPAGRPLDPKTVALRMHRNSLDRSATFQTDLVRSLSWDVLLSLFIAGAEGLDVPLASLRAANRLSPQAGEEAVDALVKAGLAQWKPSGEGGGERKLVELTPRAVAQMDQFLQRVALSA